MNLNDLYLVSQIAAVLFVAPTLVYVAVQARQNTKLLRATARYQFVEATGAINVLLAGNREVAAIFRKGCGDIATLSDDERMQFTVLIGHCMQIYSVMFDLHDDGILPQSQWHNVNKDLLSLLRSPGGVHVWNTFARHGLDRRFVAFGDGLLQSDAQSYDLTAF
jgi:hypothetical protein